jgi:hypothetical protein
MLRCLAPTSAFLLFLGATPAVAQYGAATPAPPEPRGDQAQSPATAPPAAVTPTAFPVLIRAAACSIGRDPRPAIALLGTAPFSAEERTEAAGFVRAAQRCLRQREPILAAGHSIRAAVAEALYEGQFAAPPAARTPALAARPLTRPGAGLPAETALQLEPMYLLADCTAARPQDPARAVLATEPGSPEEGAAFTALHPAFGACVPPGTRVSYDPRFMRGFLAEALYRWSAVQRDGPTAPWAAAPAAAPAAAAPSGQ